jgi:mannose-6-phosphate isomerase-like protein (cupin superfamily)
MKNSTAHTGLRKPAEQMVICPGQVLSTQYHNDGAEVLYVLR